MEGKEKHYFTCANSAKGFQNLFDSNLADLQKLYILKGGPGTGKSTLMKKIGENYQLKGFDVEYIHCSSDPDSLDGMIVRDLGVGIVDGTKPHVIEPKAPGAVEEYVNLGIAWDIKRLEEATKEIKELSNKIAECYPNVYEQFQKALKVHDEWERVYISNMNMTAANQLTEQVIEKIFSGVEEKEHGRVYHRFFGGATSKGAVDFVENLTSDIKTRYFIKGRPGSGKSTMLKKILRSAEDLGLDIEVYHCGLDPDSLDMLLFPTLSVCIFDSTAPHEYEPSRTGDSIIDMYQKAIRFGTDEENELKLNGIKDRYRCLLNMGMFYLERAKQFHDELESYYINVTNFQLINEITDNLIQKIDARIQ
ncbi:MAG: PRK06851 family protein [Clostridiales bacterium]|nr:PRK06851 family protein [Clostridiales bacterium]